MNSPLDEHVPLVFVDTNAFYPVRLADLILSSVDDGLFELCVSDHLLDEVEHVLVNSKGLPPDKAKTFRDAVEANAARVIHTAQYEPLAQKLDGSDADDLYHLAAAIEAGADFIVTDNTHDFITARVPDGTETPKIVTPDELFSWLLLSGFEDDLTDTVQRISDKYKNPPRTPMQILDGLEKIGLKKTVEYLRGYGAVSVLEQQIAITKLIT